MFTLLGKVLVQLGLLKLYSNPTLGRVVDQIGIDNVLQGKPKHDKKQVPNRIKQCF